MLEGGEDPRFIARRMVILASEDIGNADPQALLVAVAAAQAVEHVGLPEARLNLAQAAVYLAPAPKSNASYPRARRRGRRRPRARPPASARRAPLGRLPRRRQARPRQGLPLSARGPRRLRGRLPSRRAEGPRLLHAFRQRRGDRRSEWLRIFGGCFVPYGRPIPCTRVSDPARERLTSIHWGRLEFFGGLFRYSSSCGGAAGARQRGFRRPAGGWLPPSLRARRGPDGVNGISGSREHVGGLGPSHFEDTGDEGARGDSTARAAVSLASSRIGFTSTGSSESRRPDSATSSRARWASR